MNDGFNTGKDYGLKPIGLSHADMNTPGSDTERRSFPGLATKSSVFAWGFLQGTTLCIQTTSAASTNVINLRQNTATGGSSTDVPTWAAGCVISMSRFVNTMGTSTYHSWYAFCPLATSGTPFYAREEKAAGLSTLGNIDQIVVPFFDEPTFTVVHGSNGSGTATTVVYLQGFVRNV